VNDDVYIQAILSQRRHFCNGNESCEEANKQCVTTGNPCPDDWQFCNGIESCDEANKQCVTTGIPVLTMVKFCDGIEYCDETY